MYIGLHVKYRLFLSDCNETRSFATVFEKYSNIKILPLGAELFHEEGQTDGQTSR